jgi:hypothetical protein
MMSNEMFEQGHSPPETNSSERVRHLLIKERSVNENQKPAESDRDLVRRLTGVEMTDSKAKAYCDLVRALESRGLDLQGATTLGTLLDNIAQALESLKGKQLREVRLDISIVTP